MLARQFRQGALEGQQCVVEACEFDSEIMPQLVRQARKAAGADGFQIRQLGRNRVLCSGNDGLPSNDFAQRGIWVLVIQKRLYCRLVLVQSILDTGAVHVGHPAFAGVAGAAGFDQGAEFIGVETGG